MKLTMYEIQLSNICNVFNRKYTILVCVDINEKTNKKEFKNAIYQLRQQKCCTKLLSKLNKIKFPKCTKFKK